MMLSILSCVCWQSVYLLWRNVYLGLLPIFGLGCFFFSSRRRHTRWSGDWSSDVCSSDLIRDLNEGPDSVKLWAENIDRTLYDINHNKILFDTPPREMEIKTKINKWDIMKLLHSKGNHKQDEKTTLKMWENICKWINGQTINLQNNKQLMQLNIKKQTTQSKNRQKT